LYQSISPPIFKAPVCEPIIASESADAGVLFGSDSAAFATVVTIEKRHRSGM
jgi:hypothetical protein